MCRQLGRGMCWEVSIKIQAYVKGVLTDFFSIQDAIDNMDKNTSCPDVVYVYESDEVFSGRVVNHDVLGGKNGST